MYAQTRHGKKCKPSLHRRVTDLLHFQCCEVMQESTSFLSLQDPYSISFIKPQRMLCMRQVQMSTNMVA